MSYTRNISIFTLLIGVTLSGFMAKSLDASYTDMKVREVEALLSNRMENSNPRQVHFLTRYIFRLCKKYDFRVSSMLSVIETESSFDKNAISPVGAVGLMQIMPRTAAYIAKRAHIHCYHRARDLRNPYVNLSIGIAYLSYLRHRYVESHKYLAAYNMGPTKLDRLIREQRQGPASVRKYVKSIHNGVYRIRREAQRLLEQRMLAEHVLAQNVDYGK